MDECKLVSGNPNTARVASQVHAKCGLERELKGEPEDNTVVGEK